MAQRQLETAVTNIAHSAAELFHEDRIPVTVNVCYADGSCWQPGLGCEALGQAAWEPILARTLHSALERAPAEYRWPVCITIWFSDHSSVLFGLPPESAEAARMNDLSRCKQAITKVLHDVKHRLTTTKILEELQARDLIWGDSTVKRALAEMVREHELTSRKAPRPRGYGLPAWPD